jgi:phospholipid transport system substrate-binding protein
MRSALLAVLFCTSLALPARANDLEKPVKTLVGAVRYAKDDLALKQLDGEAQGTMLLGAEWSKGSADQRKEFSQLFNQLFSGMAFPKIRESLQHLETSLFDKPVVDGDKGSVNGTLVILHPLKKQEMKVKFDLHKLGGAWKIVDVTVLGTASPSMLTGIRDEQVQPLLKQGGWERLLGAMRDRAAKLKAAAAK